MHVRLSLLLLVAALSCGCNFYTTNTNTNTGGSGGHRGNGGGGTPTAPTPTPTPTPANGRTPDPPAGSSLGFPSYAATVVASVSVDVSASCTTFGYLDAAVDALRARDTRWGYACANPAGAGCSASSLDKIAYHAAAGPEVTGALGNWLVDLIADVCGVAPARSFSVSYDTAAGWTSRGRF